MDTRLFVEDSFGLSIKGVVENLRWIMEVGRSAFTKPRADIDYWLENPMDPSIVLISVGGGEPQRLNLEWQEITFGERAYFRCVCGNRATKLYLPVHGKEFKCRQCHGLRYQLNSFDRNSAAGRSLYQLNRLHKLANSRASMGRILYKGNYTKRFERFLGLCERAGYDSIVKGANDLRVLLKP